MLNLDLPKFPTIFLFRFRQLLILSLLCLFSTPYSDESTFYLIKSFFSLRNMDLKLLLLCSFKEMQGGSDRSFVRIVYFLLCLCQVIKDRSFLIRILNTTGTGASRYACDSTYRGSTKFSEVETVNARNFLDGLNREGKLKGFIDFHAYSQMWFIPWGYTSRRTNDYEEQVFNFQCYCRACYFIS